MVFSILPTFSYYFQLACYAQSIIKLVLIKNEMLFLQENATSIEYVTSANNDGKMLNSISHPNKRKGISIIRIGLISTL
jgi:hypothetical protein